MHGRAFNVGQTEENYRIRDVAELIRDLVGAKITYAEGASADRRNYRVSCDRLARELPEFQPRWTVAKGIEQLAEAYRRYDLSIDDLLGERHQRLQRIVALRSAGRISADLRWTDERVADELRGRTRREDQCGRPG